MNNTFNKVSPTVATPKQTFVKMQDRWEHIANPKGFFFGDKVKITDEQQLRWLFDDEQDVNNIGVLIGVSNPNPVNDDEAIVFTIALSNGNIHSATHFEFEKI